jgi:hypothetical protein
MTNQPTTTSLETGEVACTAPGCQRSGKAGGLLWRVAPAGPWRREEHFEPKCDGDPCPEACAACGSSVMATWCDDCLSYAAQDVEVSA